MSRYATRWAYFNMEDPDWSMIVQSLEPWKQLLTFVQMDMTDHLDQLLASPGTDVNAKLESQSGNNALHFAAQKGHQKCLEKLLDHGGDPDVANSFGFTPLQLALRNGHVKCVELLFGCGSVLSDARLAWLSKKPMGGAPSWVLYQPNLITLLLVATPSMAELGPEVLNVLYENFIKITKSEALTKMFCLTGNPLVGQQLSQVLSQADDDLSQWLRAFYTVQPLQHYARIAIRAHLRPNVIYGAKALPLPIKLQEYLLYQD